ncbi:MAG TPA: hypothetical protein VJ378_01370 [Candidatus Paceibacterota bacterium]|nr:hypothetical protein [Candidatus Paceibacterota bacterium]
MKRIWLQSWNNVFYGETTRFKFWSAQILIEGDKSLPERTPMGKWRKVAIFNAIGDPDTVFSVGFIDFLGRCRVSGATRKVRQGLFAMRLGREDCRFFIASNKGEVRIECLGEADINDKQKAHIPVY